MPHRDAWSYNIDMEPPNLSEDSAAWQFLRAPRLYDLARHDVRGRLPAAGHDVDQGIFGDGPLLPGIVDDHHDQDSPRSTRAEEDRQPDSRGQDGEDPQGVQRALAH